MTSKCDSSVSFFSRLLNNRWRILHVILVFAFLAYGLGARLYRIEDESYWLDEYITWHNIEYPSLSAYIAQLRTRDATFVPGYYALLYYWAWITDYSVVAARYLSVSMGMAAALLAYLMGARLFGKTAGLVALAFLCLSNTHIYYAQEVRVYALYILAAVLSAFTLFLAPRHNSKTLWGLHWAANMALVLSHYFGALIVATEALYLVLFHRKPLWRLAAWFGAQGILAVLLFFWMLGINLETLRVTTQFLQTPPLASVLHCFSWTTTYWPHVWNDNTLGVWIFIALIVWLGFHCFRRRNHSQAAADAWRGYVLCIMLWTLPILLTLTATYLGRPSLSLRYALPSSLPFFVLVGGSISAFPWRPLRWAAVVLLIALLLYQHAGDTRPLRPGYQQASQQLAEKMQDDDIFLINQGEAAIFREFYFDFVEGRIETYWDIEETGEQINSLQRNHADVWVLVNMFHSTGYDPAPPVKQHFRDHALDVERTLLSSGHYTFNANGTWPRPGQMAIMMVLYRVKGEINDDSAPSLAPEQPGP